MPPHSSTVEQVLLAVGEQIGHGNMPYASHMNKALVVFLKDQSCVSLTLDEEFFPVSPLAVSSTRITMSGVPPFIPNEALERGLKRFGKFASGFCTVALGCKDVTLKHVQSLRRQFFMFLDSSTQTLDVSFHVRHEERFYMVYESSGSMKCFECGDVSHKRVACPHRQHAAGPDEADSGESSSQVAPTASAADAQPSVSRDEAGKENVNVVSVEKESRVERVSWAEQAGARSTWGGGA